MQVVIDSGCDLPADIVEELGLVIVPLTVYVDGEAHRHGEDLTTAEVLDLMHGGEHRVEVLAPDLTTFRNTYTRVTQQADQVLSIHTSSSLSRVVRVARRAARAFRGRYRVEVIDSRSVSMGLGVLARAAMDATEAGKSVDNIIRELRGMIPHLYHAFFAQRLDEDVLREMASRTQMSLERISGGDLVLSLEEGDFVPLERVIDREEAVDQLEEFAEEFPGVDELFILEGVDPSLANQLTDAVEDLFPEKEIVRGHYGPLLASWLGPASVGLVIYESG